MTGRKIDVLVDNGSFYEGPRWHDGRWWVSDFYRHRVLTVDEDGTTEVVLEVEAQPSGLGWLPDGSLLVVSMKDHRVLRRRPDGEVSEHADLDPFVSGNCNDMVVDGSGRAWVGEFGFDLMHGEAPRAGHLVRVDPDGTASVAAEDMQFANGSVVTPDGATLIVGESYGSRYTAFDIGADGILTNRRVWADLREAAVAPDGCGLDAEGRIWCADALGRRCVLVAEGGQVLEEVDPGDSGVYACMLGGADGRTLLMCCAPTYEEHARADASDASLRTTTVEVPRAGWP